MKGSRELRILEEVRGEGGEQGTPTLRKRAVPRARITLKVLRVCHTSSAAQMGGDLKVTVIGERT